MRGQKGAKGKYFGPCRLGTCLLTLRLLLHVEKNGARLDSCNAVDFSCLEWRLSPFISIGYQYFLQLEFPLDLLNPLIYTSTRKKLDRRLQKARSLMKFNYDRLIRVKRTADLVRTCSVSIDQAVAVAVSSIWGTVFDVKLKEVNQQTVWRLKLLRSGERVKVFVDAKAGKILEAKAEVAVPKPYRDINSASTAITLSDNR